MPWLCRIVLAVLLVGVSTTACEAPESAPDAPVDAADRAIYADTVTVAHVLRSDPRFSQFVAGLDSIGLRARLRSPGPITLLAVPNAAFDRLPRSQRRAFASDPSTLRRVLEQHLVQGTVSLPARSAAAPPARPDTVGTVGAWPLVIVRRGLRIGPARVLDRDVPAANGRIHVLDALLPVPPEDAATEDAATRRNRP